MTLGLVAVVAAFLALVILMPETGDNLIDWWSDLFSQDTDPATSIRFGSTASSSPTPTPTHTATATPQPHSPTATPTQMPKHETATPIPSPTYQPTPTPVPTPAPTLNPTPEPSPTQTPSLVPTVATPRPPTKTPESVVTPTETKVSEQASIESDADTVRTDSILEVQSLNCQNSGIDTVLLEVMKIQMSDLLNNARTASGLPELSLMGTGEPQCHAEQMRDLCFVSHWNANGLKPHIRYSQAGYEDRVEEILVGQNYCPLSDLEWGYSESDAYVKQVVEQMLSVPIHKTALLDPANVSMEFGIARQDANIWLVVALSSDYADFESPPHIKSSEIAMKGRLKNGATVFNDRESHTTSDGLRVDIYYDSLPSRLSPGQLARTSCVDLGLMRTRLLRPLKGSSYLNLAYSVQLPGCPNPQEVSTFAETPLSVEQDVEIRMQAMREAENIVRNQTGVLIVASEWDIEGESFLIRADLSELLVRFGDGVYTAVVYGSVGGERYVVAEYPMIVDADR